MACTSSVPRPGPRTAVTLPTSVTLASPSRTRCSTTPSRPAGRPTGRPTTAADPRTGGPAADDRRPAAAITPLLPAMCAPLAAASTLAPSSFPYIHFWDLLESAKSRPDIAFPRGRGAASNGHHRDSRGGGPGG